MLLEHRSGQQHGDDRCGKIKRRELAELQRFRGGVIGKPGADEEQAAERHRLDDVGGRRMSCQASAADEETAADDSDATEEQDLPDGDGLDQQLDDRIVAAEDEIGEGDQQDAEAVGRLHENTMWGHAEDVPPGMIGRMRRVVQFRNRSFVPLSIAANWPRL